MSLSDSEIEKCTAAKGDLLVCEGGDFGRAAIWPFDYDIRICDTPFELERWVVDKNSLRNRARILAGYCWNWPKVTRSDSTFHDIRIGNYGISWNLDNVDAFAVNEESVHEAGCIHTSQGLEFDYVGVIIGDDMRYEDGHIVTDFTKRADTDNSMKGIKTLNSIALLC